MRLDSLTMLDVANLTDQAVVTHLPYVEQRCKGHASSVGMCNLGIELLLSGTQLLASSIQQSPARMVAQLSIGPQGFVHILHAQKVFSPHLTCSKAIKIL